MVAGALGTAAIAAAATPDDDAVEIVLGMAAPLAAVVGTWIAVTNTARRDPALLTGVMLKGFAIKTVFFCAYVVAALAGPGLDARPFVVSFTAYFIALYFVEALLLSRLFTGHLRQAR
jgi:hypothetical protein